MTEVIAKFVTSCTEAYGQPNSILAKIMTNITVVGVTGVTITETAIPMLITTFTTMALVVVITTAIITTTEVTLTAIEVIETVLLVTAILIAFPNNLRKTNQIH